MNRIYFNLHKRLFSVQEYIKGRGWIVVDHTDGIGLRDPSFKVSEKGRQRVLAEKQKNVHAYIYGERAALPNQRTIFVGYAFYDPYKYNAFMLNQFDDSYNEQIVSLPEYSPWVYCEVKDGHPRLYYHKCFG
jgi:hypothetical protein